MLFFVLFACMSVKNKNQHTTGEELKWISPYNQTHPLVGKIWDVHGRRFVSSSDMSEFLSSKKYILLGEKHDNPDHHRIQANIITGLPQNIQRGVGFEMLRVDRTFTKGLDDSLILAKELEWEKSGWPDFEMYKPIFDEVLAKNYDVLSTHPTRSDVMRVMKGELKESEKILMESGLSLSDKEREALRTEIVQAHCGHAGNSMVEMMTRAQEYKDAFMAKVLKEYQGKSILIAGGGHVQERGLPRFLDREETGTVLIFEVQEEILVPNGYGQEADFLIFTPRISNTDPCVEFRAQLEQMKQPKEE